MRYPMARTRRGRNRSRVRLNTTSLWTRLAQLDLSQNWLAHEIGVTSGYPSMLVSGKRRPPGLLRRRMLRALGVSFDQLFTMVLADDDHQQASE